MGLRATRMSSPVIMKGAVLMESNTDAGDAMVGRARGCMLGLMIGDALGAAVEGWPQQEIRELARKTWGKELIQDYILAVPMGTYVPGNPANPKETPEPGMYRPALEVQDSNFVPAGPPSNDNVARQCARRGMYTDDTNSCLAVGMSILDCRRADASHVARTCAKLFLHDNEAYRGCPPTAKNTLKLSLAGVPASETGLPPNFPFPGGSFANGGAMRIAPVGIAYRNADPAILREAVSATICASHRHEEAIDFAVVQAAAVQRALKQSVQDFNSQQLLQDLAALCTSEDMANVIRATAAALQMFREGDDELAAVSPIVKSVRRPGSGLDFQIASVHMAPCVLWSACLHYKDPRRALQSAIDLGGDTDTTASMVGAIVGALHGENWCSMGPVNWVSDLENGPHGRDFALGLAEKLARLDLVE